MKYINSIKTSLLIVFICFFTFCSGYTMGSSFVYADSTTDNWTQVTTNEQLVEAFRYYCKSRDVTINGGVADAVTHFTTKTFNGICNTLGIDVAALQAQLKYQTDGNVGNKFLFTALGINAYNRIFAQFLQDNDLEVGDQNVDKTLKSGSWWQDDQGNGCFVFKTSVNYTGTNSGANKSNITEYGTEYLYGSSYYTSNLNVTISQTVGGKNLDARVYKNNYNHLKSEVRYNTQTWGTEFTFNEWSSYDGRYYWNSYFSVILFNNGYLCFGDYYEYPFNNPTNKYFSPKAVLNGQSATPTTVNIVSTQINNNTYEGDTIINNYGTPSDPNNPTPDPDPDKPVLPAPDTQPATDWDIELPDLTVPNWILSGKENKFPFDIPFNVMYALSLLQAEPEAPRLEGTLDFGFYEWEYDLDLSDFDSVAEICRNMEVLAFITGLMLMTRKLIWG